MNISSPKPIWIQFLQLDSCAVVGDHICTNQIWFITVRLSRTPVSVFARLQSPSGVPHQQQNLDVQPATVKNKITSIEDCGSYCSSLRSSSARRSLILTVFIDWNGNTLHTLLKKVEFQQYWGKLSHRPHRRLLWVNK